MLFWEVSAFLPKMGHIFWQIWQIEWLKITFNILNQSSNENLSKIMLAWKQTTHDKGTLDSANTLLHKTFIWSHSVSLDVLG